MWKNYVFGQALLSDSVAVRLKPDLLGYGAQGQKVALARVTGGRRSLTGG
jgi:hypothetical protein